MDNLERLKKKIRNKVNPSPVLPFDLTPVQQALKEYLEKLSADERAKDFSNHRIILQQIVRQYLDETHPQYAKVLSEFDKTIGNLIKDLNSSTENNRNVSGLIKTALEEIKEKLDRPVEINQPKWFQQFSDSKILNAIGTLTDKFGAFLKATLKVDLSLHQEPSRAIAVQLIDPATGKPYRARGGSSGGGLGDGSFTIGGYNSITPFYGTVATAGTPVRISASSVRCKKVIIQAGENAGIIVVGNANVSASLRNGFVIYPVNAGEFEIDDVSKLYVDAAENGYTFNGYYVN